MAHAIVSHRSRQTAKPVTPTLQQKLTSELDAAHLALERIDGVILVIVESLWRRGIDEDHGLAICLENTVQAELNPAMDRIQAALALLAEVASHG